MRNNLAGNYCLANDIDAAAKANFQPVGSNIAPFTGTFDGKGHVISNLTIKSTQQNVGLFGFTNNAVLRNVKLANIKVQANPTSIVAAAGGLAGVANADAPNSATITNVQVSGVVRCLNDNCDAGGISGAFGGSGTNVFKDSWSSAAVTSSRFVGGAVGVLNRGTIQRSYATGATRCTGPNCMAGGLVGRSSSGTVVTAFATGAVTAADGADSRAGGLIAYGESSATTSRSYATGPVTGGATGIIGGLVGQWNATGPLDQTYAVGLVSSGGASAGGLAGNAFDGAVITNSYWDTDTTGQATSDGGTGLTTAQLQAELPPGFDDSVWDITPNLSYPYLTSRAIDFASALATLVENDKVFTFLPISQFDESQYLTPPEHADEAALAAVYTMIARAIGITEDVNKLDGVAIDRFFWDDAAQKTRFRGPVTDFAELGTLTAIDVGTPIDAGNVIGAMDLGQLVILRGRFRNDAGVVVVHWMLGTLYTTDAAGNPTAVVANDPWTGQQVRIDLVTKDVIAPADFPLRNFRVNGYRPVTLK
jgi:hypothetical protein